MPWGRCGAHVDVDECGHMFMFAEECVAAQQDARSGSHRAASPTPRGFHHRPAGRSHCICHDSRRPALTHAHSTGPRCMCVAFAMHTLEFLYCSTPWASEATRGAPPQQSRRCCVPVVPCVCQSMAGCWSTAQSPAEHCKVTGRSMFRARMLSSLRPSRG